MKRAPRVTKGERRELRAQAAASREGWRDYTDRQGEEWLAVLSRLPADWVDREGGRLLVPPWLCVVIDAWTEESFGSVDPAKLTCAVALHGPNIAAMLLSKLATQWENEQAKASS